MSFSVDVWSILLPIIGAGVVSAAVAVGLALVLDRCFPTRR